MVMLSPQTPQATVVAAREQVATLPRSQAPAPKPLPMRWDAPMLEPARRNPFGDVPAPVAPAAPPAPKLVVPQAAPVVAAHAPPAAARPFAYRYVGRVIDPQGQRVVYIGHGDVVLAVQSGTQLGDGYVVEMLSESTIEFVNPATQHRHTMAIPPEAAATAAADNRTIK